MTRCTLTDLRGCPDGFEPCWPQRWFQNLKPGRSREGEPRDAPQEDLLSDAVLLHLGMERFDDSGLNRVAALGVDRMGHVGVKLDAARGAGRGASGSCKSSAESTASRGVSLGADSAARH